MMVHLVPWGCSSPVTNEGFVSLSGKAEAQAEGESGPGLSGVDVLSPEQAGGPVSKKGVLSCKGSSAESCASSPSTG